MPSIQQDFQLEDMRALSQAQITGPPPYSLVGTILSRIPHQISLSSSTLSPESQNM